MEKWRLTVTRLAPALHVLAKTYGVDPWTAFHEWPIGKLDFVLHVLRVGLEEERRAHEEAMRRSRK